MRILAFHGFWKKSEVWDEFRRHFNDCAFFAPNINWEKEKSADFLDSLAREKKPDVIIGYSYGGYAVQQLFELEIFAARLVVLIAPPGPKGLGLRSFFCLPRIILQNRKKKEREKFIPEKLGTLFKVFPHMGTVTKPIHVSTLVISGGKDCYVSCDDAEKTARFHGACHHHYRDLSHSDLLSDINVVSGIKKWVGEES